MKKTGWGRRAFMPCTITDPKLKTQAVRLLKRDFEILIGIDPGTKTGFGLYHQPEKKLMAVETYQLHAALAVVLGWHKTEGDQLLIRMEDARLRRWLPAEKSNSEYRGKLMGAGSVKRDCCIWQEFFDANGINYELLAPAAGASKWTPEYFKMITGWTGVTSNHGRDAAALVYGL